MAVTTRLDVLNFFYWWSFIWQFYMVEICDFEYYGI